MEEFMPNTKIVVTLGPATDAPDVLPRLLEAGADVFRLNMSHGTREEHAARIEAVRREAAQAGRFAAILLDLQGPKIRVGTFESGEIKLRFNEIVTIEASNESGAADLIRLPHPEVRDLWSYEETGFHHLLVAAVEQRFEKEAMRTAFGLLGQGQLGLTKVLVTVGTAVNPRRLEEVLDAIADHFDPSQDFHLLTRVPFDTLDFTSMTLNLGSKMILDATPKKGGAQGDAEAGAGATGFSAIPDLTTIDRRIRGQVHLGRAILVIQVEADPRGALESALAALRNAGALPRIVAAVSPDIPLENRTLLLWGIFTRFDPARDVFFEESKLRGAWPVHRGRMAIDATFKEGYPAPLEMAPAMVQKVDRRWKDYGIDLPV